MTERPDLETIETLETLETSREWGALRAFAEESEQVLVPVRDEGGPRRRPVLRPPSPGEVLRLGDVRALVAAPPVAPDGRLGRWTRAALLAHPLIAAVPAPAAHTLLDHLVRAGEVAEGPGGELVHVWCRLLEALDSERPRAATVLRCGLLLDFSPPVIRLGFGLQSRLVELARELSAQEALRRTCRVTLGWDPVLYVELYARRPPKPAPPRAERPTVARSSAASALSATREEETP